MLQTVVLNEIFSVENKFAVVTMNYLFAARLIVVLPYFLPSCQIFGAVDAAVVF